MVVYSRFRPFTRRGDAQYLSSERATPYSLTNIKISLSPLGGLSVLATQPRRSMSGALSITCFSAGAPKPGATFTRYSHIVSAFCEGRRRLSWNWRIKAPAARCSAPSLTSNSGHSKWGLD